MYICVYNVESILEQIVKVVILLLAWSVLARNQQFTFVAFVPNEPDIPAPQLKTEPFLGILDFHDSANNLWKKACLPIILFAKLQ